MFGNALRIEIDGFGVTMRPPKKTEAEAFAEIFSSLDVQRYLNICYAMTPADEGDWWEKVRKQTDQVLWAIVPDGQETPIGNTGLHEIHPLWGSCTSGIAIAKPFWGKGIAYRCHLLRTWYAVNVLNRTTIQSSVRAPNEASLKALLKVGYRVTGHYDRNVFREGKYLDTYVLSWVNPYRAHLLYPEGIPSELDESLAKAKLALEFAETNLIRM